MGLHPSRLKRIARTYERCVFEDPQQELPWVMHLGRPSELELAFAQDASDEMVKRFVTGGWIDDKGKFHEAPEPFVVEGEDIIMSERVCQVACRIAVMQDPNAPDDELYDEPLDIIALIPYYPTAWNLVMNKYIELLTLPKAPSANTGT